MIELVGFYKEAPLKINSGPDLKLLKLGDEKFANKDELSMFNS